MSTIRSVLTDPSATGHLTVGQREPAEPGAKEKLIRVRAFSLNRGEIRMAETRPAGTPIGWDVAGELKDGTRVVAFCGAMNGWAEEVVLPESAIAPIPDEISFETACSLPVAAGTALACIDAASGLVGRRVLVTGVTGGVGGFAVQLAKLAGAEVTAQVRSDAQREYARSQGADQVVVTSDGAALEGTGPFRLFVDGIGGSLLKAGLTELEADGVGVSYGLTGAGEVALPIGLLLGKGRANLRGLNLYAVSEIEPPSVWLRRLVDLVSSGRLRADVNHRGDWSSVGQVADDLVARRFHGKAVLTVD